MKWIRRRRRGHRRGSAEPDPPAPQGPDPRALAERFWCGWQQMLPEVSAALGDREPNRVENQLCELVAGLHPELHFSIERGQRAIYALVVTGQEDPRLRAYTDAWKAAAPADDAVWEYHDSVPAVPDPTLVTVNIGAHRVPLRDVRVVAQVDREAGLVDVAVHHPAMAELDDAARTAMTYLPLDATLGERLAGERLRRVETAPREPSDTLGLLELRALVYELAGQPRPDGRPGDDGCDGDDGDDTVGASD